MTPSRLGPGKIDNTNLNEASSNEFSDNGKPIIGVSASYNKDSGEIYSIMYLVDKNKNHNPEKYRYKPLNDRPYGLNKKKGTGVEFKAPPNSAVNKIELFHNGDKIRCMKFYCADIKTGEPVKVLDPSTNKMRSHANIGGKISRNDKTLNYEYVETMGLVLDGKYYPTFISKVEGFYDRDKGINMLGFTGASVYENGFSLQESSTTVQTCPVLSD